MTTGSTPPVPPSQLKGFPFSGLVPAAASIGLFVIFFATLLTGILPPRLLDPEWQLALVQLVVNNAAYPLLGFVLWHLAAHLEPTSQRLVEGRNRLRRLAVLATMLFLLLIPLQVFATLRAYRTADLQQARQLRIISTHYGELRNAIRSAADPLSLQARLQSLQGPQLAPGELAKPLPQLRRELLAALTQAEAFTSTQLTAPRGPQIWQATQNGIRVIAISLAMALAFAAGAQQRNAAKPLLLQWLQLLRSLPKLRGAMIRNRTDATTRKQRDQKFRRKLQQYNQLRRKQEERTKATLKKERELQQQRRTRPADDKPPTHSA